VGQEVIAFTNLTKATFEATIDAALEEVTTPTLAAELPKFQRKDKVQERVSEKAPIRTRLHCAAGRIMHLQAKVRFARWSISRSRGSPQRGRSSKWAPSNWGGGSWGSRASTHRTEWEPNEQEAAPWRCKGRSDLDNCPQSPQKGSGVRGEKLVRDRKRNNRKNG
jgi:hypothetical protein